MNQNTAPCAAPAIGQHWPEEGGILVATMPALYGNPAYHIIVAADEEGKARRAWGGYGEKVEGLSDIDGLANTKILAATGKHPAASFCADLRLHGKDDWYLFANREASLLRAVSPELFGKGYHWTSTQYSAYGAFGQDFGDGVQIIDGKDFEGLVRAVRRVIA